MRFRFLSVVFMLVIVALLIQQGYFTDGVNGDEPKTLFVDISRAAGITQNREGIEKVVGQAVSSN